MLFFKGGGRGCYKFLSLHVNFIIIEIIMSLFIFFIWLYCSVMGVLIDNKRIELNSNRMNAFCIYWRLKYTLKLTSRLWMSPFQILIKSTITVSIGNIDSLILLFFVYFDIPYNTCTRMGSCISSKKNNNSKHMKDRENLKTL